MHAVKLSIRVKRNLVVVKRLARPADNAPSGVAGSRRDTDPRRIKNFRATFTDRNRVTRSVANFANLCFAVFKEHTVEFLGHAKEQMIRSQPDVAFFNPGTDATDIMRTRKFNVPAVQDIRLQFNRW